jgi:hypothetical protein
MWPFKSNEPETNVAVAESAVEETVAQPAPAPFPSSGPAREPRLDAEEMAEYIRVSAEVGIDCCTDLTREKLLACLREENVHIFDNAQVIAYLDEKLGNDWEWRGLRTVDVEHLGTTGAWHTTGKPREVYFARQPYRGAVPLPVLLTVQKIQRAVPEVYFYVSAPKGNDGDPFLCVTNRWLGSYIIERWDEPNFRER